MHAPKRVRRNARYSRWRGTLGWGPGVTLIGTMAVAGLSASASASPSPAVFASTRSIPNVVTNVVTNVVRIRPDSALTIPRDSSSDSATIAAAAAASDTGRMSTPYRDISRYDTPGYCLAAVSTVTELTWRKHERDTVASNTAADTIPTVAVAMGRRCLAQLPGVEHVAPAELPGLLHLAALIKDTALVRAVTDRRVALASTDEARGFVLYDAIEEMLRGERGLWSEHPMDLTAAQALTRRLDSLGTAARIPRLLAHRLLLGMAETQQFDTTTLLRENETMRQISALLTPEERKAYQTGFNPTDSLIVAMFRRDPNLPALARRYLDQPGPMGPMPPAMKAWVEHLVTSIGKPAPPLVGKFWYPTNAPHVAPVPGKVTLFQRVEKGQGFMSGQLATLRRLYDKYHEAGLEIVLVTGTHGYSWSSPPQTTADEAKTDAWYFSEFLKLPFTVVVQETPFQRKPDGRRVDGQIDFSRQYPLSSRVLVGRDGRIYSLWVGLEDESQLNAVIPQALAASPTPPVAAQQTTQPMTQSATKPDTH